MWPRLYIRTTTRLFMKILDKIKNAAILKKPDDTQVGRYLAYLLLIAGAIYFIFGQDISIKEIIFPDKPYLILLEDYTNKPEWSITPAILDPQYYGDNNETIYSFLVPVPLSISVKNKGKKSVEVARLELEYSPAIKVFSNDEADKNKLLSKKSIQSKEPVKIIHDIGTINPGESKRINDLDILIFENTINRSINVTTQDNVTMSLQYEIILSYIVNYTIYTKNNQPSHGTFVITVGPKSYFINNTIPFTEVLYFKDNNTLQVKYYNYTGH